MVDDDKREMDDMCEELDDILGGLLDSFSELWEKEFQRRSEAEDIFLARRVEKVSVRASESEGAYVAAVETVVRESDDAARRISRLTAAVEEHSHAHQVAEIRHEAQQARKSVVAEAMRDADDFSSDITDNAARRRQEREAKRKEEKRKSDAEMEARWRQREEADRKTAASSPAPEDREESRSKEPPPRAKFSGPRVAGVAASSAAEALASAIKAGGGFAAYDDAWKQFEKKVAQSGAALAYADVPWPKALTTISGVDASDTKEVRKKKLRDAVLRWHPDKWSPLLDRICEADRAQVVEEVKAITRRILDERKRFLR